MSRLAWLTTDVLPTDDFICRRLRIPNDVNVIANVNGALWSLCEEHNWEQRGIVTVDETVAAMQAMYAEYSQGEACLIGAILPYATSAVPDGCLDCDGTSYLKDDYPMLYAALDSVYIVDADNFVTPDLRGRNIIGSGEGTGLTLRAVGDNDGEETHVLTASELAVHTHTAEPHTHTNPPHSHFYETPVPNIDIESAGVPDVFGLGNPKIPASTSAETVSIDAETVTINESGEDTPHNNMPPYHVLRYCIVAR